MAQAHSSHGHGGSNTITSAQTRWVLGGIVGFLAVAAVAGAFVLRPDADRPVLADALGFSGELV